MVLLMKEYEGFDDAVDNGTFSAHLQGTILHLNMAFEGSMLLRQADQALQPRVNELGLLLRWAKNTLYHLSHLLPFWSPHGDGLFKNYCRWAFTPRPKANGLLAFKDCVLDFHDGGIAQVPKATVTDCYSYIPESLVYKPADEFVM